MKFSVVIPCYNSKNTITDTVRSVLDQTFKDYELLVINDGSTDGTDFSVLNELGCIVLNQENGGVSRARNTGIKNAKGEFICFLDADDLWENNHLEVLDKLTEKYEECDFFCTSSIWSGKNDDFHPVESLNEFAEDFYARNIFEMMNSARDSIVHTNSVCLRKAFLEQNNLYFAEGITNGEDADMWLRCGLLSGVVFSKKETTRYLLKNSRASAGVGFIDNWVFISRLQDIYEGNFSKEIKHSCYEYMDRYYLCGSRYFAANKNKKRAFELIKKVKYRKNMKFVLSYVFVLLPSFVTSKMIS